MEKVLLLEMFSLKTIISEFLKELPMTVQSLVKYPLLLPNSMAAYDILMDTIVTTMVIVMTVILSLVTLVLLALEGILERALIWHY